MDIGKRREIMSELTNEKLLSLEKRVIKLQKEVLEIVDKIYKIDDTFGDVVNEELQDEKFIREERE